MMRRGVFVGSVLIKIFRKCAVEQVIAGNKCNRLATFGLHVSTVTDASLTKLTSSSGSDVLSERLKEAQTPERIVELLSHNSSSLTASHLVAGLSGFVRISRHATSTLSVIEPDHLRFLCKYLLRKVHFLELEEVVLALNKLNILRVSLDSVIIQTLLQILRLKINDLSILQIFILDIVLRKPSHTPLVDTLRVALPIVMQNHLEMQLNDSNVALLAKLFWYGSIHKFHPKHLHRIAIALLNLREQWSSAEAFNVLWGAVFLRQPENILEFRPVILTAVDVLIEHMPEIQFSCLAPLLERMHSVNLLSVPLLRSISKQATSRNWSIMQLHRLLSLLTNCRYVDFQLLETYAQELVKNAEASQMPVCEAAAFFAKCNYAPSNVIAVVDLILKQTDHIGAVLSNPLNLVGFALNLILLDRNSSDFANLLSGITPLTVQQSNSSTGIAFLKDLALLKIFMKQNHWNENLDAIFFKNWDILIDSVRKSVKTKEFPLRFPLLKAVGHQYIIYDGVVTRSGNFIDHLLVQHDTICSIEPKTYCNQHHFIEDIGIPENITRMAVLVHTSENYAINAFHSTGKTALMVKALKQEGYIVKEICLALWKELLEHERLHYLQHAISDSLNNKPASHV